MLETAIRLHAFLEAILAHVGKRRMSKVMRQCNCLSEVFVHQQGARQSAGDLGDFKGVCQARAEQVAFVADEYLRLALERAESGGMDNTVTVALERCSHRAIRLGMKPATCQVRSARIRCEGQ